MIILKVSEHCVRLGIAHVIYTEIKIKVLVFTGVKNKGTTTQILNFHYDDITMIFRHIALL